MKFVKCFPWFVSIIQSGRTQIDNLSQLSNVPIEKIYFSARSLKVVYSRFERIDLLI